jgi:hypothetical protein
VETAQNSFIAATLAMTAALFQVSEKAAIAQSPTSMPPPGATTQQDNPPNQFALIDQSGKIKALLPYSSVGRFSEGLAAVGRNDLFGYIDKTGKEVIPLKFQYADDFSEGLACVALTKNHIQYFGYIDKAGKTVIAPQFDAGNAFLGGGASVMLKDVNLLIDKHANVLKRLVGSSATGNTTELSKAKTPINFKEELVDIGSTQYKPLKLEDGMKPESNFSEGLCRVRYGKNSEFVDFIDLHGRLQTHGKFQDAGDFKEDLAPVTLGLHKLGYIDRQGKLAIPACYDVAESYSEGLASVRVGRRSFFIDKSGKVVIEPGYYLPGSFSEGLAPVSKYGLYGYINKRGARVIDFKFLDASQFKDGVAVVTLAPARVGQKPQQPVPVSLMQGSGNHL